MLQRILSASTKAMEKSLDASWLRNEIISQNIANVDTPGYKRKTVQFEEFLDGEMKKSRIDSGKTRLTGSDMRISEDHSKLKYRLDGNNVDIEQEMALMAQNSLKYNTVIQRLSGEFRKLRSAISGGR